MKIIDVPKDFGYQAEHGLLREQARKLLRDRAGTGNLRRLGDDGHGEGMALHRQTAELGWIGLCLPAAAGGAGLDRLAAALLMEQVGEFLLPTPLLTTTLSGHALHACGSAQQQTDWLPRLLGGSELGTLAWCEPNGRWDFDQLETRVATQPDGTLQLQGVKTHVDWGAEADWLLVPAVDERARTALLRVQAQSDGLRAEPDVCIDPSRRTARITFDDVRVESSARLGEDAATGLAQTLELGWLLLAAQMLGGAEGALELTRGYACERVQFGKKIGAFQAVKHPLVDVMLGCERTRSLVYAAAAAQDAANRDANLLSRMAKASANDTYTYAVDRAIQLHGGFGFTWDCDAHYFYKHAVWSRVTFGDSRHHRRHLAATIADSTA